MRMLAYLCVTLAASACRDAAATDAAAEAAADAFQDAQLAEDAVSQANAACVTLTVAFAGCDAERLAECEREYAVLPPAAQTAIVADGACFRASQFYTAKLNTTWPATAGTCAAALSVWEHWFHGGCQGQDAQVSQAILAADPCVGTAAACSTLTTSAICEAQQGCMWDVAGVCAGQAAACTNLWLSGTQCAGQLGCTDSAFAFCGRSGQPACFFTGTL